MGINAGSVDIDETQGMLFELSTEYDEKYKFRSAAFDLPVMVKDPDLDEIYGADAEAAFAKWQDDFNKAEDLAYKGRGGEAFDIDGFVDYLLVCDITRNSEVGWPKSVYVYKNSLADGELYHVGPLWDFDAAFGSVQCVDGKMDAADPTSATWINDLFYYLTQTPGFRAKYAARFEWFKESVYPELMEFIDSYAAHIEPSAKMNAQVWSEPYDAGWISVTNSYDTAGHVAALKEWLHSRVEYLSVALWW